MNAKLKQWLDDNTIIDIGRNSAYWYHNIIGRVTIGYNGCDMAYISLCDKDDNPIYTDCLSYGYHGWATGDDSQATADSLYSLLPQDVATETHAEYDRYADWAIEIDMADYLRTRNGWSFDDDYYNGKMTDEDLVKALGLPHDADADEIDMDDDDGEED